MWVPWSEEEVTTCDPQEGGPVCRLEMDAACDSGDDGFPWPEAWLLPSPYFGCTLQRASKELDQGLIHYQKHQVAPHRNSPGSALTSPLSLSEAGTCSSVVLLL